MTLIYLIILSHKSIPKAKLSAIGKLILKKMLHPYSKNFEIKLSNFLGGFVFDFEHKYEKALKNSFQNRERLV